MSPIQVCVAARPPPAHTHHCSSTKYSIQGIHQPIRVPAATRPRWHLEHAPPTPANQTRRFGTDVPLCVCGPQWSLAGRDHNLLRRFALRCLSSFPPSDSVPKTPLHLRNPRSWPATGNSSDNQRTPGRSSHRTPRNPIRLRTRWHHCHNWPRGRDHPEHSIRRNNRRRTRNRFHP